MAVSQAVQDSQVTVQDQRENAEIGVADILSSYKGEKGELIAILQDVQGKFGYLPEQAMQQVAKFVHVPESTVFGIATFYTQFKLCPVGRNIIKVCRGTACYVRGGSRILDKVERELGIKAGETTPDMQYSLETIACFGSCALAPVVVINDKVYGKVTAPRIEKLLKENTTD